MSASSTNDAQPTTPTFIQAISTTTFIGSVGVDTKLTWLDSAYYAPGVNVLTELQYLGIHNVRDGANAVFEATKSEDEMLMANGIKFDLGGDMPLAQEIASLDALEQVHPGSIIAVEGLNEASVANLSRAQAYQTALYTAVKSDPLLAGIQVYNYTVGSFDASAYTLEPDQASAATMGNAHSYSAYFPPYLWNSWYVGRNYSGTAGLQGVVTETGYNTATTIALGATQSGGVSQAVQAKYELDTLLDMLQMGVKTTYLYELMDSFNDPTNIIGEDAFGLFRVDGTPKEAAVALHNLTTILSDPGKNAGTFALGHLSYSIQGLNSNFDSAKAEAYFGYGILNGASVQAAFTVYGNSMLLEKSNGTFDLAVWKEPEIWDAVTNSEIVAPVTPVTVTLGEVAASVMVYDPLAGSSPIETLYNVSQIMLSVTDHPLILEIDPKDEADVGKPISASLATTSVSITDASHAAPFSAVTISDPNAGQVETARVTLSNAANGTLSDPNAAIDGSSLVNGVLTLSGSSDSITAALDALVFTPTNHQVAPGQSVSTIVTATITDTAGQTAAISSTVRATAAAPISASLATAVTATISPFQAPARTPAPAPAPIPAPTPPDNSANGMYGLLHNGYQYGSSGGNTLQIINLATGASSQLSEGQIVTFADGVAIADPNGTVGEVLRLYQAAFDRLPTASEANGVNFWENALQQGSTLRDVAQGFTTTPEYAAHYAGTTDDQFVSALYSNVLGRTGEPGGQAFWDSALQSGESRGTILMQFAESPENESRTIASSGGTDAAEITRLYQAAFNRNPDAGGLSFWQSLDEQGVSLVAIATSMQSSTEYQTLYAGTSNDQFIQGLYKNILGDSPGASSDGVQFWDGQLAGGASRASVLIGFSDSLENRLQTSGLTHDGLVFLGS